MFKDGKHPSLENIIEFAEMKSIKNDEEFKKSFSMASHFVECEKCRRLKDSVIQALKTIEEAFDKNSEKYIMRLKVFLSLEELGVSDEMKNTDILWSLKGKTSVSGGVYGIKIKTNNNTLNREIDEERINEDEVDYLTEVYDENDNFVFLSQNNLSVSLSDDGKEAHSVLLISETGAKPSLMDMKKEGEKWLLSCECDEDDYDIVVL